MSVEFPIVSVLGAAGTNIGEITGVIDECCHQQHYSVAVIDGDGFHRYGRADYLQQSDLPTHFHPDANHLDKLQHCLGQYSLTGGGQTRQYLHDSTSAGDSNLSAGSFTEWSDIPTTDLLIYEGLHGCYVDSTCNIAQYMDLKIGVVPIVNLEWQQRAQCDIHQRGYTLESVIDSISSRMPDYVRFILPQFSRTDINIQAIPLVDTSNPFITNESPTVRQTWYVIRESHPEHTLIDFPTILSLVTDSFMSRHNSIVVPESGLSEALRNIFSPLINRLLD